MRVWFITGASRGFGALIAEAALKAGDAVAASARDPSTVTKRLGTHDRLLATRLDVTSKAEAYEGAGQAVKKFGRIDILVNNAGILKVGSIIDSSNEDWEEVCRVNLSGVFYCSKAVLPLMLKQRSGKIINIASISAFKGGGVFGNALYGTTKAGVIALTKGFARELGPFGINVNSIAPGLADTGMTNRYFNDENRRQISQTIPMGRLATTGDIAKLVVFLASDASGYITGETITVDGGYLTR